MRKKRKVVKNTRTTTNEYLKSEHWEQLKKDFSRQDEVCAVCGTPHWHLQKNGKWKCVRFFVWHHMHYRTVGHESREDLQRLCKRDHDICHKILRLKEDCDMVRELKEVVRKYFDYTPNNKKGE